MPRCIQCRTPRRSPYMNSIDSGAASIWSRGRELRGLGKRRRVDHVSLARGLDFRFVGLDPLDQGSGQFRHVGA